ncbi:hypothetical protein A3D88_00060 [Candidatus Peribacteria bacterium RIFCSPHIGHO2_02_FULL_52_16]|nr:MAG: hypothetical protein A2706_04905 [Candidatus Peribacteria bacterium RIFCSPHIGHO2_01_FULL_51_35]OGJ61518.1 MAG: hypothetical protein A3D88_00060 [Candidatus Peribacteria bacterium RIFCSPHIGHO2_02_FULL_52_16]
MPGKMTIDRAERILELYRVPNPNAFRSFFRSGAIREETVRDLFEVVEDRTRANQPLEEKLIEAFERRLVDSMFEF